MQQRLSNAIRIFLAVSFVVPVISAAAIDELTSQPTWQQPTDEEAAEQVLAWIAQQSVAENIRGQAEAIWTADAKAADGFDLLERVAATIILVEPRAASIVDLARGGATPVAISQMSWLDDESTDPLVRNNLKLLLGRGLVQKLYFDEAISQLDGLLVEDVVDPASLLFYSGVARHRLYQKKPGLDAIDKLLENKEVIPRRYATLARLMRADLAALKDGSLDDISRRMQDVERRLGHGRANKKVRDVEDEVIKMLDKLIEEEEAKQAAAAAAAAAAGGAQSSRPMPDSFPGGGKGPGHVTKRNVGNSAGWGELPPKQREEAMQEIGREFPAHYREVIEEYFREIAKQDG